MPIILMCEDDKVYEVRVNYGLRRISVYEADTKKCVFRKRGLTDTELNKFIKRVKTFKKMKLNIIHKDSRNRRKTPP